MTHELKILPKYFDAVNCGLKNFEIRINDRNYQEDDELILKEWERGKYTGRECRRWVGYIYHGDGTYGIAENTVVMALKRSAPMKSIDGADLTEATATANHFFGREGQEADRKTSNCSEKPNNCETCKHWEADTGFCYSKADSDDHSCHYEQKTEPQTERSK